MTLALVGGAVCVDTYIGQWYMLTPTMVSGVC